MLQLEKDMQEIAKILDACFENRGFALIVFEFHNPGIGNYVSNAERSGMIKALRETADRLEANEDIPVCTGSC